MPEVAAERDRGRAVELVGGRERAVSRATTSLATVETDEGGRRRRGRGRRRRPRAAGRAGRRGRGRRADRRCSARRGSGRRPRRRAARLGVADAPTTPATAEPRRRAAGRGRGRVPEAAPRRRRWPTARRVAGHVDAGTGVGRLRDGHGGTGRVFASPLARRLAHEAGLRGRGPVRHRPGRADRAPRRRAALRPRALRRGRQPPPAAERPAPRPGRGDAAGCARRTALAAAPAGRRAADREQARPRRTSTCAPPCRSTGCSRCAPSSTTAPRSRVSVNDLVVKAVAAGARRGAGAERHLGTGRRAALRRRSTSRSRSPPTAGW